MSHTGGTPHPPVFVMMRVRTHSMHDHSDTCANTNKPDLWIVNPGTPILPLYVLEGIGTSELISDLLEDLFTGLMIGDDSGFDNSEARGPRLSW